MNDAVSDNENSALTHEEAVQILRLSPAGLRRLADLDEAITELRAARRSLLANRLESIRDAFAAARKERVEDNVAPAHKARADDVAPASATPRQARVDGDAPANGSTGEGPADEGGPIMASPRIGFNGADRHEEAVARTLAGEEASLAAELRRLRREVAELRREVAALTGLRGSDADIQQVQRRLSYLEAELESREI